ncbi:MAG: helix-turn-helix transcriptional regulator [Pseudonocardiales bacterium]|nr:helix-turn-helix transcriptional regulator [Pseudonocardiales bacterium]
MAGMDDGWTELTLGERIRRLRNEAVMTQDDLAATANVSTDLIRKLEQGQRQTASLASLSRIAAALNVDLGVLLGPTRSAAAARRDRPQIVAIRDALTNVADTLGELDGVDVPDLADLGHVAAREALRLAAGALDPLRLASARSCLGHVLILQGRYADAERVHVATAQQLEPTGQVSAAHWSVYGGLLLGGASSAARQGRSGVASDLLAEAAAAAHQTERDRIDYDVTFGPGIVVMQTIDCAVVTGDYVAAAETARRMPRDSGLPLVSRSRHLVDVAHTQLRLDHPQAAESALLTLEHATPEWAALHRLPRVLVGELLTRGRPSSRLRELADRLQATPAPLEE